MVTARTVCLGHGPSPGLGRCPDQASDRLPRTCPESRTREVSGSGLCRAEAGRRSERLVDLTDPRRVGLRHAVVRQEAVELALDVGQLRPHEAGDVVGDLLDDAAIAVDELVGARDVAVREVGVSLDGQRDAAALAEPQRQVVARAAVLRQLGAVVVDVDEVGVLELVPARTRRRRAATGRPRASRARPRAGSPAAARPSPR